MAKIIKITQQCKEELRREFEAALSNVKLSEGKLNYTKSFGDIKRAATVYFTKLAWDKMQALIQQTDKEVAWHGLAYRGEDDKDEYFITDILVYPQEVTGAEVNTDQKKYQMWLMSHEDDVFNNIRMQGHSHVNMGVTPSSVDNSLYERILEQLDDEMFYIFLIYNKRGDKTFKIYDLAKNILFETGDVTVKVMDDFDSLVQINIDGLSEEENIALSTFLAEYRTKKQVDEFVKNAKQMVTAKVYRYSGGSYGGYGGGTYGGNYGGYGGYNYGDGYYRSGAYNPAKPGSTTPTGKKEESKKQDSKDSSVIQLPASGKAAKRRGKRKRKKGKNDSFHYECFGGDNELADENFAGDCEDTDDGPYSYFGFSRDGLPQ